MQPADPADSTRMPIDCFLPASHSSGNARADNSFEKFVAGFDTQERDDLFVGFVATRYVVEDVSPGETKQGLLDA